MSSDGSTSEPARTHDRAQARIALDDDQATHVTSWDAAGNLAEILPGDFWPSLA